MKRSYSIAATIGMMVVGMSFSAKADVSFCLANPTPVYFGTATSNEVGIVIAPQSSTSSPTITADSFYGQAATVSSYWKQSTSTPATLPAGCYVLAINAKSGGPDGTVGSWYCASTTATQSTGQLIISGAVSYATGVPPNLIATASIIGPTSNLNSNPGNTNCPPPGQ